MGGTIPKLSKTFEAGLPKSSVLQSKWSLRTYNDTVATHAILLYLTHLTLTDAEIQIHWIS